jgi:hypothetical protein
MARAGKRLDLDDLADPDVETREIVIGGLGFWGSHVTDLRAVRAKGWLAQFNPPINRAHAPGGLEQEPGSAVYSGPQRQRRLAIPAAPNGEHEESDMISELQIHVIARQMFEKHGFGAIAQAAQNAIACEGRGETDEAREWRHLEDAMKMMRGPHQS